MRISDWSSDVCSSDLGIDVDAALDPAGADLAGIDQDKGSQPADRVGFHRLGLEVLEGGREERQTRSYPIVAQAALETALVIGGDLDRKSVVSGKSVSVSVDHGGRRIIKKKNNT